MTQRYSGRLAIHRRSDEIAFLQARLRTLSAGQDADRERDVSAVEQDLAHKAVLRERDLADELLHTRQTEPLGETLQRRLAMAERVCAELSAASDRHTEPYRVAETELHALSNMLQHWWAWLQES